MWESAFIEPLFVSILFHMGAKEEGHLRITSDPVKMEVFCFEARQLASIIKIETERSFNDAIVLRVI